MIGQRIKNERKRLNLTQEQLAKMIGTTKQNIYKYEVGIITNIPLDKIQAMADVFDVSPAYLSGWDYNADTPSGFEAVDYQKIPLVGEIACGAPITAEENVEDYIAVPAGVRADFCLRCKGDSMKPTCMDGDLVLIRLQPDVEDGQIAAVIIDGEATLKHVYHLPHRSGLQLVADNPAFPPILFTAFYIKCDTRCDTVTRNK